MGQPNHVAKKDTGLDQVGCVGSLKEGKASGSVLYSESWGVEEVVWRRRFRNGRGDLR